MNYIILQNEAYTISKPLVNYCFQKHYFALCTFSCRPWIYFSNISSKLISDMNISGYFHTENNVPPRSSDRYGNFSSNCWLWVSWRVSKNVRHCHCSCLLSKTWWQYPTVKNQKDFGHRSWWNQVGMTRKLPYFRLASIAYEGDMKTIVEKVSTISSIFGLHELHKWLMYQVMPMGAKESQML